MENNINDEEDPYVINFAKNGIEYVIGDVTDPIKDDCEFKLIIHVVNDVGGFGAGVSGAIAKKFPIVEEEYRRLYKVHCKKYETNELMLGDVQFVTVKIPENPDYETIVVANMVGQHGIGTRSGNIPIRYAAIEKCLREVKEYCKDELQDCYHMDDYVSIHAPRFGAGLSGGDWNKIESIINEVFKYSYNIRFYVYDFQDKNSPSYIPVNK